MSSGATVEITEAKAAEIRYALDSMHQCRQPRTYGFWLGNLPEAT